MRTALINGTRFPVTDARLPAMVHVKPSDEKKGIPNDPRNCMIARAVHRVLGGTATHIWGTVALIEVDDELVRYSLPRATRRLIDEFDAGRMHVPPKGINVILNRPSPQSRLGISHHHPVVAGATTTVTTPRAPRSLVKVRGGFSSYRSVPAKPKP